MTTTINQRQADVQASLDQDPVELGDGASVTEADASAVGVNAESFEPGSFALGDGTTIDTRGNVASFGLRDLLFFDGYGMTFPADQGSQTVADIPVTGNAAQGEEHSIVFTVGDSEVMRLYAEADGSGGIQNVEVQSPSDLSAQGEASATDVLAETVTIEDSSGNTQLSFDANAASIVLDLAGNDIEGVDTIVPTSSLLKVGGDLDITGELTENTTI